MLTNIINLRLQIEPTKGIVLLISNIVSIKTSFHVLFHDYSNQCIMSNFSVLYA